MRDFALADKRESGEIRRSFELGALASLTQRWLPMVAINQLPAWRNGRRKGLKIPYPERGVRVRVPPPALVVRVFTRLQFH